MPKVDLNITHVDLRNYPLYQVRISVKHIETSRAFGWAKYGGAEQALKTAQQWRDKQRKKLKLPPVAKTKSGNNRPMYWTWKHRENTSTDVVGVCRAELNEPCLTSDKPRIVYNASYRMDGHPCTKTFSCGREPSHDQERAAFEAAYAFRKYYEWCCRRGLTVNPNQKRWKFWRREFGFKYAE